MKRMIITFLTFIIFFIISAPVFSETKIKSPVFSVIFNTLPGFGIGSYMQNDTQTGHILLVSDIISTATIAGGGLLYYFNTGDNILEPIACFSIGGILFVSTKIFGIINPIRYNKNKNASELKLLTTGNNVIISYSF